MTRHELEDAVWEKLKDQVPDLDFAELESWPDERLRSYLDPNKRIIAPRPIATVHKYRLIYSDYVERDGRLVRVEQWSNGSRTEVRETPVVVDRVRWRGRVVSASIVLHYLRTGELVDRVPKPVGLKPYRAVVWVDGRARHIGYYASQSERDEAIKKFKESLPIGFTP